MTVKVPNVIHRLRQGKQTLRNSRRAMSLPEKVEQVVKLQEIELKIIGRRRRLFRPASRSRSTTRTSRSRSSTSAARSTACRSKSAPAHIEPCRGCTSHPQTSYPNGYMD